MKQIFMQGESDKNYFQQWPVRSWVRKYVLYIKCDLGVG